MASLSKRFADTSADEIEVKRLNIDAKSTIRSNGKSGRILRAYLLEKSQPADFENFDEAALNEALAHFYVDARKPDGEQYKTNSLEAIRYGLNRYLKAPPFNKQFDIIKDAAFNDANKNFKATMVELKKAGLGDTNHHPPINEADRAKLYSSLHMTPKTPCGLFNKVQFDIRLYSFRRGAENMHSMTKSTFVVETDPKTGLKFVNKKVGELTKNHRESDKESSSGVMPETPGSPYCPVASFEAYVAKLNPDCDKLWQRPMDSFLDDSPVWYCKSGVGEKMLNSFMTRLSTAAKLSQIYSNHSIRTTGATILSKEAFGAAQIMAVTGHKSVQSLTIYQQVDQEEKMEMGRTLTKRLLPEKQVALQNRQIPESLESPSTGSVSQEFDVSSFLEGINVDELLCDFECDKENIHASVSSNRSTWSKPQFFKDCRVTIIENITIQK